MPSAVVESGHIASGLAEPCVVRFASVDAVERYRAQRVLPVFAALYHLAAAVAEVYFHAHNHLRRAEAGLQLAVAAHALHVEESVAQQHAYGVAPLCEQLCHVVGVVVDGLAVFAPKRGKLAVADLTSVYLHLVVSQSAYVHHGICNLPLAGAELFSQYYTFSRQRVGVLPFCLEAVFLEHGVCPSSFGQLCVRFGYGSNPFSPEVFGHHSHILPLAPCRLLAGGVPHAHLPVVAVAVALQRRQRYQLAFGRRRLARVIDTFAGYVLKNPYAVGSLPVAVGVGLHLPAHAYVAGCYGQSVLIVARKFCNGELRAHAA